MICSLRHSVLIRDIHRGVGRMHSLANQKLAEKGRQPADEEPTDPAKK
jgi:hypothetical protein